MKKTSVLAYSIVMALLSSLSNAEVFQWEEIDGGNGHFYETVSVPEGIIWTDAYNQAAQEIGHLATITSQEENDFVFNLINEAIYWNGNCGPLLGGFQIPDSNEPDGGWQWVTGEPFVYDNWRFDQPNNSNEGTENVIHFGWGGGITATWNDIPHDFTATPAVAFILEYDVSISEPNEWLVSEGGNGHFYQAVVVANDINWKQANRAANDAGGYLVSINSEAESDFVFSMVNNEMYWNDGYGPFIGIYQIPGSIEPDGGWRWTSGEQVLYSNWNEGEPNQWLEEEENCGHLRLDKTWNDYVNSIGGISAFIIEFSNCVEVLPTDINRDCVVDMLDLSEIASDWLISTLH